MRNLRVPSHAEFVEAFGEVDGSHAYGLAKEMGDCRDHPAVASYVNFGDTYDTTVLLDHETNRLQITSYGDWVESHGNRQIA